MTHALYNDCWLRVKYRNQRGYVTENEVMPLGLAQQGPRMYLVGRFRGFDDDRSMALHRILKADPSTLSFTRPKEFSLKRYDDEGRFGIGNGVRIRLEFTITREAGRHLLESPLSSDQSVSNRGDRYRVTATVMDTNQLRWWLMSFGDHVSEILRGDYAEAVGDSC